jgi:anti-sigma factor RsiW
MEINDDLAEYIAESSEEDARSAFFYSCPLCRGKSLNVEPATVRRIKFLAISAAIIIAYGAWNSAMYQKATKVSEEVQLPEHAERIGSIEKDLK